MRVGDRAAGPCVPYKSSKGMEHYFHVPMKKCPEKRKGAAEGESKKNAGLDVVVLRGGEREGLSHSSYVDSSSSSFSSDLDQSRLSPPLLRGQKKRRKFSPLSTQLLLFLHISDIRLMTYCQRARQCHDLTKDRPRKGPGFPGTQDRGIPGTFPGAKPTLEKRSQGWLSGKGFPFVGQ